MDQETFSLKNCPIFSVGQWNGDVYDEADLDHMVAAYNQVGFKPPIKLGHDESQPMAKSDSMPSLGWVTNLRRIGKKLYADITGLPRKVYEAIRRKNYDRVSAEVYWDYAEGGKKLPRVLKALALLGAEIPAVTDLDVLASLYDASGKPFRRYDMGMMPYPEDVGQPSLSIGAPEPVEEDEDEKKDKAMVKYRNGGEDFDGDADEDYCGQCRFWEGPPDPNGKMFYVGQCSLVDGEIGSNMLCDLHEDAEAWAPVKVAGRTEAAKTYVIQKRGDKWVLIAKSDGKVLGTHDSEADAKAQEAAIEISKHAHAEGGGIRTFTLSAEAVKALCPDCADKMAFLNLKELKLTFDPATKTYAGFSQGLCDRFGEAAGFRTRCMDDSGKLSESVDDMGAFCNSLKEYCFGSVSAESEQTQAKTHSDAAGGFKTMADMQVEEKDGQWCVTAGGKDVKCFDNKPEADAYLETEGGEDNVNTMAERDATIKALTEQLAAAATEKVGLETKTAELAAQVATLGAKVPELEKYVSDSETEKAALKETARQAGNTQWIKDQTAEGSMRLLPVEVPLVAHLLDQLTQNGGPTLKSYKAEDGKELSAVEAFKSIFERRKPGTLLFEELSKGRGTETAGDPAASDAPKVVGAAQAKQEAVRLAKQYMKDKNEKSISVAMAKVYEDNPELKEMAAGVTPQGADKAAAGGEHMARMFKK